ncbi:hypothetical protein BCR35DRAFT_25490 [Leucosporidium creatinivorum]|uniref:Uncharacterized protein n=1 Tax=Leucosporidium creatinivorum TaxID=106004 RepID=A0A1Y2CRQ0_9BASI|nr:hypothetical protein BCR35DRAFT_25490 [Leucosporidium creatinivorum]
MMVGRCRRGTREAFVDPTRERREGLQGLGRCRFWPRRLSPADPRDGGELSTVREWRMCNATRRGPQRQDVSSSLPPSERQRAKSLVKAHLQPRNSIDNDLQTLSYCPAELLRRLVRLGRRKSAGVERAGEGGGRGDPDCRRWEERSARRPSWSCCSSVVLCWHAFPFPASSWPFLPWAGGRSEARGAMTEGRRSRGCCSRQ